ACNKNLDNLEVMCLEINPIKTKPQHYDKMKHIIGTWLTSMGVKHYDIVQTGASNYVFPAIENFLQNNKE
ncbi:MAG: hypothetical protein II502_04335, partial [Paludibacteraceae bacterium]|nr:hypothetical protein [Paludibacteraceae bacterium]